MLIGSHSAFRLGPPHPVDVAGIMSGGFEPFLRPFDLLLGGQTLLGGERRPRAEGLSHVYKEQPRYDTDADNNWKKVPSHTHASATAPRQEPGAVGAKRSGGHPGRGWCRTCGFRALADVSIGARHRRMRVASNTRRLHPGQRYAAVPVIAARLASVRGQFLCHSALRAARRSHGVTEGSRAGTTRGGGKRKLRRARPAPPSSTQARSQNDEPRVLILRAGGSRAGLPDPHACGHRRVQRVPGAAVQPLPSMRAGRGMSVSAPAMGAATVRGAAVGPHAQRRARGRTDPPAG